MPRGRVRDSSSILRGSNRTLTLVGPSDPQSPSAPLGEEAKATEPAKVTITKVFDFAGEEIRYVEPGTGRYPPWAWYQRAPAPLQPEPG